MMQVEHRHVSVLAQPNSSPAEIVITRTNLPVLRAGIGLLILPMVPIFSILLYVLGRDASGSPLIAGFITAIGAILGLLYFAGVAARVSVEDGAVRILRSLDVVVVPNASIKGWSVRTFSVSRWVVLCIWRNEGRLPVFAHFVVADTTSAGDFRPTVEALRRWLGDTNA